MDIKILMNEIKTFIIENRKTIIFSTSIVLVIVILIQVTSSIFVAKEDDNNTSNEVLQQTYSFDVYVEQDNLGVFTNSYLLESLLTRDDIVSEIEKESNLTISPVLEKYNESHEVITTTDDDPINVKRDTSTNIMTVSFGIGTGEENREAAEVYYEWFSTTDLAFFDDKSVFEISEPQVMEKETIDEQLETNSPISIIIRLILTLFGGIVLGVVISLMRVLFNKKIMYGFAYSWGEEDIYLNYSDNNQYNDIAHSIAQPNFGNKVILSETDLNSDFRKSLKELAQDKSNLIFSSNVSQVDSTIAVDEFVIIVKRKESTKQWYQNQRRQLKSYRSSIIKVVQI